MDDSIAPAPVPSAFELLTRVRDTVGPWLLARTVALMKENPLGSPYALLTLPGERSSFGGQDVRSRSERWLLRQGETYWVQIGLIRRRKADKLAIVTARTPPVRAHAAASQTGR